jgi:hypothetical protein
LQELRAQEQTDAVRDEIAVTEYGLAEVRQYRMVELHMAFEYPGDNDDNGPLMIPTEAGGLVS